MDNSFYSDEELNKLGFKTIGKNCLISRFARFYSIEKIEIGNYVRIDDFCILSGSIQLGSYIHISAYCALYGNNGITIGDFSGLSPKSIIFSASDDFSGNYLINPMVPLKYRNVIEGEVKIGKYVQLGANTIVMPNCSIGEGAVTGSMALVNSNLDNWQIYVGIPVKVLKKREKKLLQFVKDLND